MQFQPRFERLLPAKGENSTGITLETAAHKAIKKLSAYCPQELQQDIISAQWVLIS